jgi:anti-sigma factor RsiW
MQDKHITELFVDRSPSHLSVTQIAAIESHVAACSDCARAYAAAKVAQALIQARADSTIEVGPFFATRLKATLRERSLSPQEPALLRMWKAARVLVSTMAALLAILIGLTLFGSDSKKQWTTVAASEDLFSPESVVLLQRSPDEDELANDEVISTIYSTGDSDEQ